MLDDISYVSQSLNSGLYFLRTLREFAINIQLSFLENNNEYIEAARDFGKRAEDLIQEFLKYANGNVSREAIENKIFVTDYTLDTELLTEKLFPIDIDTTITEKQLALTSGSPIKPSTEVLNNFERLNKQALVLVTNFIDFCRNIISRMSNNELFSYSYVSLIEAMLIEANIYKNNLNRIIDKNNVDPTFISDYEYLFNNLLRQYSSFIRGFVDPKNARAILRAGAFSSEFSLIANDYKKIILTPESQDELKERSIDTIDRFKMFLSDLIEDLLGAKTYFIVEPTLLDNILTTANYFKYTLTS